MATNGEIFVVPFLGQGHFFPCMELCKHICLRNYKITLAIPSSVSSSVPSAFHHHPLIEIVEVDDARSSESNLHPGIHWFRQVVPTIESLLSTQPRSLIRPVCAVVDLIMIGLHKTFSKFNIPTVSYSTSAAGSAAMDYATWRAHVGDMVPGETRILPGLPEHMAVTFSEIKRRPRRGTPSQQIIKQYLPGDPPMLLDQVDGSIALMFSTCDDLERPFIEYVAEQSGKPVWGVGPLLPEQYWKSVNSILRDSEIKPSCKSSHTEDEVLEWLNSKPRGCVIYISFGSGVSRGPTLEEYGQLADALAELNHPFIWVIQPGSGLSDLLRVSDGQKSGLGEEGYYPRDLKNKVGDRGLIIRGCAPQLMILSHPSTGGFLTHCGWNSTVEAIGRGIPLLAWPFGYDQFFNAKLVVCHLKVGYMVTDNDLCECVKKEDIVKGIERLMRDEEVHRRAAALGGKFKGRFPTSSVAALDAFSDFILGKSAA